MKQKTMYPLGTYMIERKDGTLATAEVHTQSQAQFFHAHLERLQIKTYSLLFYKK